MEFDLLNEIITGSVGVLFGYDNKLDTTCTSSFSSFKREESIEYQTSKTDSFFSFKKSKNNEILKLESQSQKSSSSFDNFDKVISSNPSYSGSLPENNLDKILKKPVQKKTDANQIINLSIQTEVDKKKKSDPKGIVVLEDWLQSEALKLLNNSLTLLKLDENRINKGIIEKMSYEGLTNEKKKVKNELKKYDMAFEALYHRQPVRNEKEPMRPLYIYYKLLKQAIHKKEEAGLVGNVASRDEGANGNKEKQKTTILLSELKNKLEDLKKQKNDLRLRLQSFQEEFSRNNNRKIKYNKDIQPIESEYKRYKEVKEEITKLETLILNTNNSINNNNK